MFQVGYVPMYIGRPSDFPFQKLLFSVLEIIKFHFTQPFYHLYRYLDRIMFAIYVQL